jgi:hypothetical protein
MYGWIDFGFGLVRVIRECAVLSFECVMLVSKVLFAA